MDGEVVEDDDVAGPQRRHQDLLDVGQKRRVVDRAIEHRRRAEAVLGQACDHGVRLPVAARRVSAPPLAARRAPIAAEQIGRHAGFIEKDVLAGIPQWQAVAPPPARRRRQGAVDRRRVRFF